MFARATVTILAALSLLHGCIAEGSVRRTNIAERAQKFYSRGQQHARRNTANSSTTSWRYENKNTEPYKVTSFPGIDFDFGEIYSGTIPVGNSSDRSLFFVFNPKLGSPSEDLTIWLNGGPGCSSLEGFIQENGPFIWTWGQYNGLPNPYTWANLTNMLWVEYPVGTGFSQGEVTANSEEEIAKDFVGFFKNFQELFGISNYKIYVTGESYAGRYVPYVASAIIDQKDPEYFNLSGILIYDPTIGSYSFANDLAAYPQVKKHTLFFNLNATYMHKLDTAYKKCGYEDYNKKYLSFPPPGIQPPWDPDSTISTDPDCLIWDNAWSASFVVNPCFNEYLITGSCPILFDPLSFPTDLAYNYATFDGPYFNRADVKKALHAPEDVSWAECAGPVFTGPEGQYGNSDTSLDPIQHVLPKVIEHTGRVLIAEGDYDFSVVTDATLISIQNMTWNGHLGFQKKPQEEIVITIPDLQWQQVFIDNGLGGLDGPGQGVMGVQHFERGLMWAVTYQSGHMQPQFQPRVSYRHLEWLLGKIDKL